MGDFTDMEIFARVITAGSLSAAGRELGLSPAVVSKRLKRLEERLGTRLLQRTTRQIALTEAGRGYHDRVVQILASIEEAEAYVSRRSDVARGTLRISAPTSFGRLHVAPHLGRFLDANPGLVKTMSVKPPRGSGRVRLVSIGDIDLQPCGGTHVRNTAEIGLVAVTDIEKKGKQNRRVRIALA